jgi:DNA-binding transcriptional LysR family regulator
MQNGSERGVRPSERALRRPIKGVPDWEGAHLFLELIRRKSFRAASDHLGISVNGLRARISDFERSLGVTLVTRHVDGVRPTAEGEQVLQLVNDMEKTTFKLMRVCEPAEEALSGEVRLAVTEGLGALWIGTKLVEFQRLHTKLMIDFHATMRSADVLRMESDISVQLTRPTAKELKVVKLGRLHFLFFAAQSYLDLYGYPKSVADLANHRLVMQTEDNESWHELYNRAFPGIPPEKLIAQRSNVSSVHYWAITRGAGIGMLPTYVYAVGAPVIPLDLPVRHHIDIWLTYHESASSIPRVRKLCDWLIEAFSPKIYPWFRDDYVAPAELKKLYSGRPLTNPLEMSPGDNLGVMPQPRTKQRK